MSRIPSAPPNTEPDKAATGGLLSDLRGSTSAEASAPEMMVAAPRRRRPSTQTLVLLLVLAASAASLYTMRKQGMASGIVFTQVKLDYDEKKKPDDMKEQRRIMAELARSVSPDTFRDEPLRKNPFRMDASAQVTAAAVPTADTAAAERAAHEADIRNRYGSLTLNGVMMGPTPLARISGKTYTVSDTVDEVFVIREIRDRAVDLIADGKNYTLQMSDTSAPGGGGRRPGGPNSPPPRR